MALTAITASTALSFMTITAQLNGLLALYARAFWPYFYNTMAVNGVKNLCYGCTCSGATTFSITTLSIIATLSINNIKHNDTQHTNIECLCAECRYAECRYAECRGADAVNIVKSVNFDQTQAPRTK